MDDNIHDILSSVYTHRLTVEEAQRKLKELPVKRRVNYDFDRRNRRGFSEAIYAEHKTIDELTEMTEKISGTADAVLYTRISARKARLLCQRFSDLMWEYYDRARILILGSLPRGRGLDNVHIVLAGTSDWGVAEEAELTLKAEGIIPAVHGDVGVAGLHRLLNIVPDIYQADVIIVIAGMEGALPSVVSGLVASPVIAVPTSVGYGAHFHGLAALLTMLNSCSEGIGVVNIDNGFGAARLATLICHHRYSYE